MARAPRINDLYAEAQVRNPGVSVNDAVAFFVHALKDPINPLWCSPSIVAAMLVIQPDGNIEKLLKSHHSLWSTAISFVTIERSLRDIEGLDRRWSQCHCNYVGNSTETRLHLLTRSLISSECAFGPDGGLGLLINSLIRLFVASVDVVSVVSVAKGRKSDMWPVSPGDLIPHSPEESVTSIVNWGKFIGGPYALLLISCLMRICHSLIIPAVVSSDPLAEFINEQGRQLCSDVLNARRAPNEPVHDALAEDFYVDLWAIISFLSAIKQCLPGQKHQFHARRAADSFEFLSQAVHMIESPIISSRLRKFMQPMHEALSIYAANLYVMFPEEVGVSEQQLTPSVARALAALFKMGENPALGVWQLVRHFRRTHICYALDCGESLQTSGRTYQRCSGCLVVGYSSKECQRRAWKDPRAPHRDICKKLRRVVDAGKGHFEGEDCAASEEFGQDLRRANIVDSELNEIIDWLESLLSPQDGPLSGLISDKRHRSLG